MAGIRCATRAGPSLTAGSSLASRATHHVSRNTQHATRTMPHSPIPYASTLNVPGTGLGRPFLDATRLRLRWGRACSLSGGDTNASPQQRFYQMMQVN
jgi:hypothetical protein